MNKVTTIHLHGVAFQLEERGYDSLRAYLDNAARQLNDNPDKAEIIADIEQAIADKFSSQLKGSRNVILADRVEAVIDEIGPVADEPRLSEPPPFHSDRQAATDPKSSPPKRLYRIKEGAMISGVCNGLAVYLGADVTILRLIVAILVFVSIGTVAVAYLVAVVIVPKAETPEQKAAAAGPMPTAKEFIRRAREGYYEGRK